MTTTKEYLSAVKVNGWVIDKQGRKPSIGLVWRCWRIDEESGGLNNRQMSFKTKGEAVNYARTHN